MKHKHCDLIVAWANGAEIEVRESNGEWQRCYDNRPTWQENLFYRIKPEPKPDKVVYGWIKEDKGPDNCSFYRLAGACAVRGNTDNIKLTFDGETGKLKSAEVINV